MVNMERQHKSLRCEWNLAIDSGQVSSSTGSKWIGGSPAGAGGMGPLQLIQVPVS